MMHHHTAGDVCTCASCDQASRVPSDVITLTDSVHVDMWIQVQVEYRGDGIESVHLDV